MQIEYVIAYGSFASVLIPLSIAMLDRSWKHRISATLLLLLSISLLTDALSFALMSKAMNTHLAGNIYMLLQFSLLLKIYYEVSLKKASLYAFAIFMIVFIVNIAYFQGPWRYNSFTNSVASLILVGFSLHYLYQLLNQLPAVFIQRQPMLWISFAVLTYYGGNFFLILLGDLLLESAQASYRTLWILHNLLNVTKNILFSIALWQSYRSRKLSSSS